MSRLDEDKLIDSENSVAIRPNWVSLMVEFAWRKRNALMAWSLILPDESFRSSVYPLVYAVKAMALRSTQLIKNLSRSSSGSFGCCFAFGVESLTVASSLLSYYLIISNRYVDPEYACTGMLTEKSDIYRFDILIMEVITGRSSVEYSHPPAEVHLVGWLKMMVGYRKSEEVVDPKLKERPASKALKRVLLIALRCVDPDAQKRPKMGHVIHMLESEDLLIGNGQGQRIGRESSSYLSPSSPTFIVTLRAILTI